MGVSVSELVDLPFYARTREEKLKIVQEGKPRPPFILSAITVSQSDGQVVQAHRFDQGLYDLLPWLTRCDKRKSFFCWPCLLFSAGKQWSETGVPEGQFLVGGVHDHEKSPEHIQAVLDWRMFIKNHEKPQELQSENRRIQHGTVTKNREILKRVIDSICYVVMRTQALKENDDCNQLRKKDCISVLEVLRIYDTQFVDHIDEAICLLNVHPKFLPDVVDAITSVAKLMFKKETQQSTYVSVILSEHSEISRRSQISTILRYIKAGKVCERFVGFINMPKSKCADVSLKIFGKTVSEFGIKERFLAQSVDGAVVHASKLRDLVCILKAEYPYSLFVPCYFHGLDYILQQSISHIKECGLLFRTLNEIGNYLKENSKQWKYFERFMIQKMPYLENTNWFERSQLAKVVNTYRKYFIEYFANSEINCFISETDLVKVGGFKSYLEDFDTVYLLRLLTRVFEITAFENSLLNSEIPENAFDCARIEQLKRNLRKEQETGFEKMWLHLVIEKTKEKNSATKKTKKAYAYRELFNKIISVMLQEIENRFNHLSVLEFCHLLNHDKCNEKSVKQYVEKLLIAHKPYFDEESVKVESIVLRNNEFAKKPVHDLLEFFIEANLQTTFPYHFKLAELVLTLPVRKTTNDSPSKLEQVKKWSYTSEENDIPGDASILFIEKDFLKELMKNTTFYEDVILTFNALSNYMDLIYQ